MIEALILSILVGIAAIIGGLLVFAVAVAAVLFAAAVGVDWVWRVTTGKQLNAAAAVSALAVGVLDNINPKIGGSE